MQYIFNNEELCKNDSMYIFCGSPELSEDIWFVNYPYGYIQAIKINNDKWWYIKYVFINIEYRNKGYGRKLFENFIKDKNYITLKALTYIAFKCYRKCKTHTIKLYNPNYQMSIKKFKFYKSDNSLLKSYDIPKYEYHMVNNDDYIDDEEIFKMPLSPWMVFELIKSKKD